MRLKMALNKFYTDWRAEIAACFDAKPCELTSDDCWENYRYYNSNIASNGDRMTNEEWECADMLRAFYATQFEWLKRIGR